MRLKTKVVFKFRMHYYDVQTVLYGDGTVNIFNEKIRFTKYYSLNF